MIVVRGWKEPSSETAAQKGPTAQVVQYALPPQKKCEPENDRILITSPRFQALALQRVNEQTKMGTPVIKKIMPLDPKKLEKSFVKLRKLVRKMSKDATQDEVHDIRTNTRRVEATLQALQLNRNREGRRLLRAVTPVRKKAGDVRDMDVLTGFSATLSCNGNDPCLVKLLEHLGQERGRGASKLRKTVAKHRKVASRSLKACASLITKNFDKNSSAKLEEWPIDATAEALRISGELSSWPRLSSQNLHPFRLKVKELRYVLQLSGKDSELTERLGELKDAIGEWHDWTELDAIAKSILSDCKNCKVIAQVGHIAKQKFQIALKAAQQLRSKYFEPEGERQKRNSKGVAIKEPVLKASARLAA
jgi:CHAD domain-containing protein